MSIVTRFASYFIKSRVVNYSLQVDRIMTEMCKSGFQDPEEGFLERDPMSYYECRFYSHIARNWTPRLESFEKEQYELARQKFVQFENLYSFILDLHRATWEYRSLYLELTKEIATHNTWFRSEHTTLTYEHHLEEAINKYINLLDQLKEYPLWQERVKEEIGYYLHLIYNSTTHSGQSKELFAKFVYQIIYISFRINYISSNDCNHMNMLVFAQIYKYFIIIVLISFVSCHIHDQGIKLNIHEDSRSHMQSQYALFTYIPKSYRLKYLQIYLEILIIKIIND